MAIFLRGCRNSCRVVVPKGEKKRIVFGNKRNIESVLLKAIYLFYTECNTLYALSMHRFFAKRIFYNVRIT